MICWNCDSEYIQLKENPSTLGGPIKKMGVREIEENLTNEVRQEHEYLAIRANL